MLVCPQCSGNLVRRKTPNGLVYACNKCTGRMVGLSVLRKERAERGFMNRLWRTAREEHRPSDRSCPHCHRPMSAVDVPIDHHSVTLDVCTRCSCLWFDPGEYEDVPRRPAPQPKEKLSAKARQAIALAEVKRIVQKASEDSGEFVPDQAWQVLPAVLGLPVECDAPTVCCMPWMTWGLSATIVAVFVATWPDLDAAANAWGFIPAHWLRHYGATLITPFFLHAGIWHLLSNLYFFLIFGDNVEDDLGKLRFAGLLLAAELMGAAAHASLDPRTTAPSVGASAAISGVIAYYAVAFPHARIGFMWRYWAFFRWIRMSAWAAFALWVCLQFLLAWMQTEGATHVSGLAHLGGAVAGLSIAITLRCQRSEAVRG